jgi:hypothetical protein
MKRLLLLLTAACSAAFGQVTTNLPVAGSISITNATQVGSSLIWTATSGASLTLNASFTCGSGGQTCTYDLYAVTSNWATVHTGSLTSTLAQAESPTHTTLYVYTASQDSGSGSFPIVVAQWFAVVVGAGGDTNITQSTAIRNGKNGLPAGPGVPSILPNGQYLEITYTNADTITNYLWDTWGVASFTNNTSGHVYYMYPFFYGGANAGATDTYGVRFSPPIGEPASTWNYSATIGDATNYQTFSTSNLFTTVADATNPGHMLTYGSGNYNLFKYENGTPMWPYGVDIDNVTDLGNNAVAFAGGNNGTIGTNLAPTPTVQYLLNQLAASGVNLFSLMDANTRNILSACGPPTFTVSGIGKSVGANTWGLLPLDALMAASIQYKVPLSITPDASAASICMNSFNVFTNLQLTVEYLMSVQMYLNRFGYGTSAYTIDSEQTLTQGYLNTMGYFIKQHDPYYPLNSAARILVTSVQGIGISPTLFSPNVDFLNTHLYISAPQVNPTEGLVSSAVSDAATYLATTTNTPLIEGETGGGLCNGTGDSPSNQYIRQQFWSEATLPSFITTYPGGSGVGPNCTTNTVGGFVGQHQLQQIAYFNNAMATMDPAATTMSPSVSGGGGPTVAPYCIGDAAEIMCYLTTTANQGTATGETLTLTWPTANMVGLQFYPATGVTVGTVGGYTSTGHHAITLPTWGSSYTSGHGYANTSDLVAMFWNPLSALPHITTPVIPACQVSTVCAITLSSTGGSGSGYTYSIVSGAIPHGMTFNGSAGTISGTPDTTAGVQPLAYDFTVQVNDSGGNVNTQPFIYTIYPAISVVGIQGGNGVCCQFAMGQSIGNQQMAIVYGGAPPVTCAPSGSLPSGLSYSGGAGSGEDCIVSGTLASTGTNGSYNVTLTGTDANGATATGTFSFTVANTSTTPVMESTYLPNATQNYTWSPETLRSVPVAGTNTYATGSLCAGLSTTAPATSQIGLYGSPTGSGTCNFTITPTNSNGAGSAYSYGLTIGAAPTVSTSSLPAVTYKSAFYQSITTTGNGPVVCSELGLLPAGVFLDSVACQLKGTPQVSGAFPITVYATDINGVQATQALTLNVTAGSSGSFIPLP